MAVYRQSQLSKVFTASTYIFLGVVGAVMLLPFIYVVAGSFTSQEELTMRRIVLIPVQPTLDAYKVIFSSRMIFSGIVSSVIITSVGTLIAIVLTVTMAYPLSKKHLMGRSLIQRMVVFTLLFNAGLIPTYMVIRAFGMIDTYWSLWLPGAINAFNLILMRNFIQQIPAELEESARIDGANELVSLIKIVIPLSMPAIATFTLFYAVMHWNGYFTSIMYINSPERWPIQVWLRQIVILSQGNFADGVDPELYSDVPGETVKLAVIVVATIPILTVYPFLQRYFVKGVMMGSVKG
jgi:putative aldouronate transport system permease protein